MLEDGWKLELPSLAVADRTFNWVVREWARL